MAGQDAADGPGGYAGLSGETSGAEAQAGPGLENGALSCRAGSGRGSSGTTGTIGQTYRTFVPEPADPAVSTLPRDAELSRDMSHGPAIGDDPLDEEGPPMNGQTGIIVGHKDLLARC